MIEMPIWAVVVMAIFDVPSALIAVAVAIDAIAESIEDRRMGR